MIDLVRSSAVPANLMQAAARGALSVPPPEMIEILVYLANHNKIFGQTARMTLAGWDEKSSLAAAADPATPQAVLDYLIAPENLRPQLLPALLENPAIAEETLISLAASGAREVVNAMLRSLRVQNSSAILNALASNPNVTPAESTGLHQRLQAAGFEEPSYENAGLPQAAAPAQTADEAEQVLAAFLLEHAKEIAAEGEKPFQPIGGIYEGSEAAPAEGVTPQAAAAEAEVAEAEAPAQPYAPAPKAASRASGPAGTAHAAAPAKFQRKTHLSHEEERGSALQKISKLDIKGRIQLAMKGTKEERSILVRDGTKLVALAVLDSPKISDGEVEKFASQKNVLEVVLRTIPMKRRFAKNYAVLRNLVFNPRTPIDVSLGLMKNLLIGDLRNLSANKEVSETIRKLALKMFKQKVDPARKSSG
jgi:hypothetical protein